MLYVCGCIIGHNFASMTVGRHFMSSVLKSLDHIFGSFDKVFNIYMHESIGI